jgi:hypothetical protein
VGCRIPPFAEIVESAVSTFSIADPYGGWRIRRALALIAPGLVTRRRRSAPQTGSQTATCSSQLRDILDRASCTVPLLLVIEDVHWADEATRCWCGTRPRHRVPAILLVVTCQPPEREIRRFARRAPAGRYRTARRRGIIASTNSGAIT